MLKMNLQLFGGRGSAGGQNIEKSANKDSLESRIQTQKSNYGNQFIPYTEKEISKLDTIFNAVNKTDFSELKANSSLQKIEGIPGKFKFVDHGEDKYGMGRYEYVFAYNGFQNISLGKTKKEAIDEMKDKIKQEILSTMQGRKRKN